MSCEGSFSDLQLFQLTRVATATGIRLSTFSPLRQLIALVLECGDVVLYYLPTSATQAIVRCIPWFEDSKKRIEAATFDPTLGIWLLLVCCDGSFHIIPALPLLGPNNGVEITDCDWQMNDVTSLGPLGGITKTDNFSPSTVTWWDKINPDGKYRSIAILGTKNGEVIVANLQTGCVVGRISLEGHITSIQICKDDTSLDLPPVFLLVTNSERRQWKIILEDPESGYSWPFPPEAFRSDCGPPSVSEIGIEESAVRSSLSSFPLTRARLQGLKQLSVEKLANLKQKLSETRTRGLTSTSLKRKGSSISEDTFSRHRVSTSSSDSESSSVIVSRDLHGNILPRVEALTDSYFCMQTTRGKHVVTGHYAPAQLITVYGVGINMTAQSTHKVPVPCGLVLLTDWLLYTTDMEFKHLFVISFKLSQVRIDGNKEGITGELNTNSVLQVFHFPEGEKIRTLLKVSPIIKERSDGKSEISEDLLSASNKTPSRNLRNTNDQCFKDQCAVITDKGLYMVTLRKSPKELVVSSVLEPSNVEKAEQICHMFGLDLQQLVEAAADRQLEMGQLESAISLYKLARCRPVKSVLHVAGAGFTQHLLPLTTALLQTTQLPQSECLHLANLSVLTFTEQCLRSKHSNRLYIHFRTFLKENGYYDEVLAASVVGQGGLCNIMNFLCEQRGLSSQVLEVLARIINCQHTPKLDFDLCEGFWECLSNTLLSQSLVANPDIARLHFQFVENNLHALDECILQRLASLYDPSQLSVRPALRKLIMETSNINRRSSSLISQFDSNCQSDGMFVLRDWLAGYFTVCVYLAKSRRTKSTSTFSSDLTDNKTKDDYCTHAAVEESLNTPVSVISAGYTHVALVRNGQLYVWGYAANGCLGVGPTLSHTVAPTTVPLFPALGIQVSSVACGRLHTLALTDNGVYSWGSSKYGQLGLGTTVQCPQPQLVEALSHETIVSVFAGQYHSMALTSDGRLYTWGWGVHGQLGHNSVEDCHYPRLVRSLISEVCVSCSAGHAHSLILTANGKVWACGSSVFGQLGTGSNAKSSSPVQVYGLPEKIIAVSTAYFHNLALAESNRLYTWGSSPQVLRLQAQAQKKARLKLGCQQQQSNPNTEENETIINQQMQENIDGEIVNNEVTEKLDNTELEGEHSRTKPHLKLARTSRFVTLNAEMVVSPSVEFKGLPAGRPVTETCNNTVPTESVTHSSGTLTGIDDGLSHLSPTLVDTSHVEGRIVQISCGCHHSALVTEKGQVYTWGRNLDAQLGNGARTKEALYPTYINIGGGTKLQNAVCGGDFTLGMESGGKIWAWGSNQQAQLGHLPTEDSSRAGLEGRMVMLKSSKRMIKLPHGSLNIVDVPREVPLLPPVQIEYHTVLQNVDSLKDLVCLSKMETPPHGQKTLHYALTYFYGYYNTSEFREKCVELEDYQTAAKVAMLDKQYDIAMGYQLKAAIINSEQSKCNEERYNKQNKTRPSLQERASQTVVKTEVIVPTLETSLTVGNEVGRKIGITRTKSNCDNLVSETQRDQISSQQDTIADTCNKSTVSIDSNSEESGTSEIHTFAIQGGTEEMSLHSQDMSKSGDSKSINDCVVDSRSETPDTVTSVSCDDFETKGSDVYENVRNCPDSFKRGNVVNDQNLYDMPVDGSKIKYEQNQSSCNNCDMCHELIEDLVHIVEFYIDLCEQGPQASLKSLLKQGLEFWTNHKLPVCRLEALLLSHWSLVSYPLGVLLLGNEPELCLNAQQMLSHLSTDFSLQLCSAMVSHVIDKDNGFPEMIDLLSSLSWSDQTSACLAGRTEHLNLDDIISRVNSEQESQPYIDIDFSVDQDLTAETPETVIAFSCGHRYDSNSSLHKVALDTARTMDESSLPNTAQALRSLYHQPLIIRHFACPTCTLECIQSELN